MDNGNSGGNLEQTRVEQPAGVAVPNGMLGGMSGGVSGGIPAGQSVGANALGGAPVGQSVGAGAPGVIGAGEANGSNVPVGTERMWGASLMDMNRFEEANRVNSLGSVEGVPKGLPVNRLGMMGALKGSVNTEVASESAVLGGTGYPSGVGENEFPPTHPLSPVVKNTETEVDAENDAKVDKALGARALDIVREAEKLLEGEQADPGEYSRKIYEEGRNLSREERAATGVGVEL